MNLPSLAQPASQLCTQSQFEEPSYLAWCDAWQQPRLYKRKQWEFVYIWRQLHLHGCLHPRKAGIGFGVGQEPLPAMLAASGVDALATDLPGDGGEWARSHQHAASAGRLHHEGICSAEALAEHIAYEPVDMNNIPAHLRRGQFDFAWSANSLDHLGSLAAGLEFIRASLECVRPGGVAVHTTEFNVSSHERTLERGRVVVYRQSDIEAFAAEMRAAGHEMTLNLTRGDGPYDRYVDKPPYRSSIHLCMELGGYAITSIGLTIVKGGA